MAGIGFALQKLARQDNLASRSMAGGHAILISSGPWIVIMAGLALMHTLGRSVLPTEDLTKFSILVIYSFALSLVITAPISLDATLRVSALLFKRRFDKVQDIYVASLFVALLTSSIIGAIFLFAIVRLPLELGVPTLVCLIQVAFLWLAMTFVAAIKQYAAVTTAFAIGLSCSVVCGVSAAALGHGAGGMLIGFSVGLCIAFCVLNFLILRTFPGEGRTIGTALRSLAQTRPISIAFTAASLFGAMAVWVDKIIVWHSLEGQAIAEGLRYAPRYDAPMFIAYLSVVPVMSVLIVWLETSFFDSYRHYRDIVHSGGTLRQIDEQRHILARDTNDSIFSSFVVQITVSCTLAILSPLLAAWIGLPPEAVSVLRLAFIGSAFHFLFQACCSVILFVQYGRAYLWLQALFMVLNGVLTAAMISNPGLLSLGYLIASVLSGLLAYLAMRRTLNTLNHLTFVTNNPSVA